MVTQPGTDQDGGVKRGSLKVYLGMAPGVGKTYAMLDEAQRRHARSGEIQAAVVARNGAQQGEARLLASGDEAAALIHRHPAAIVAQATRFDDGAVHRQWRAGLERKEVQGGEVRGHRGMMPRAGPGRIAC